MTMEARLNMFGHPQAMTFIKRFNGAVAAMRDSGLPEATQELVKLRSSQINGCGMCTDMHFKDAVAAGESSVRLNLVAAWREATVFTEAERAALELAEEGTRVADAAHGVSAEVWARAAEHYEEQQLSVLVILVCFMNAVNRLNIISQQPAGDYKVGQF